MPQRVLVVEDDPDTAMVLDLSLRGEGYAVRLVASRLAAYRTLAAEPPPDLVLLDVALPDGDGLSLCPVIRQRWPALPILVVTARADALTRTVALSAGCTDVITKPFDPDLLLARVGSVIGPP